jgi:hypothetical protein
MSRPLFFAIARSFHAFSAGGSSLRIEPRRQIVSEFAAVVTAQPNYSASVLCALPLKSVRFLLFLQIVSRYCPVFCGRPAVLDDDRSEQAVIVSA